MKAVIKLDVPEWQIGQEVNVYFRDTMWIDGKCEAAEEQECENCAAAIEDRVTVVRCRECIHGAQCNQSIGEYYNCEKDIGTFVTTVHPADWFCADGEMEG